MSNVKFKDNRMNIYNAFDSAVDTFLTEASGELVSKVARNTRVDTGQLKSSWSSVIEDIHSGKQATIGSPLENAIWEEFGTGIYADGGKGRQDGWIYEDRYGLIHFTRGKHKNPKGLLYSFKSIKSKLENRANEIFKGALK
jgi:hypothetical protein